MSVYASGASETTGRWTAGREAQTRGGFLCRRHRRRRAGLLLAPKSGRETRAQLFGEGGIGAQVDRLKGALGAGKDSAADQSEALRRKIEETRERLRRQMDAAATAWAARTPTAAPPAWRRATPAERSRPQRAEGGGRGRRGRRPRPRLHAARGAVGAPRGPAPAGAGRRRGARRPRHRAALRLPRRLRAEPQPARHAQGRRPGAGGARPTSSSSPATSPAGRTARTSCGGSSGGSRPPLGVFAVLGNHDHGDSKAPFVRATDPRALRGLRRAPARQRDGDGRRAAAAAVQVAGIDDTDGGHDDLPAVLAQLDRRPGVLRLLLTHHADGGRGTAPGDFHMTFAGDTHGGQICLPLPGRRVLLSDLRARVRRGRLRRRRPARSTSRAAWAPACCPSAPSAGPRSWCSTWRPAGAEAGR